MCVCGMGGGKGGGEGRRGLFMKLSPIMSVCTSEKIRLVTIVTIVPDEYTDS